MNRIIVGNYKILPIIPIDTTECAVTAGGAEAHDDSGASAKSGKGNKVGSKAGGSNIKEESKEEGTE